MGNRKLGLQLNKKQTDFLFYLSLAMTAIFVFLFLGEPGYYVIDDSFTYMDITSGIEGVMPVYPLFLLANRHIFGEAGYLYAVVIEQSVFAAFCVICFIGFLKKHLHLSMLESYICFALALLPFVADLPETVIPREILSEGIAYAAFYLFFVVLLKTVWSKSFKWYVFLCICTLLMASIRSQLQILFGVCGVVCFYILVFGKKYKKKRWLPLFILIGLTGCVITGLAGIRATAQITIEYQKVTKAIAEKEQTAMAEADTMEKDVEEAEAAKEDDGEDLIETSEAAGTADSGEPEDTAEEEVRTFIPLYGGSQYVSLIFNKGMYEADYEDYQLFEDERFRNMFLESYEKIDEERCRYAYAEPGLWMWRDIADSGRIGVICMESCPWPEDRMPMGIMLIKAHFGRFLYHMLMLMPQAFVSTVFFQIERFYLLCHLVTLFLYVSAIALTIWAYADKRINRACGELMSCVLVTNCILVVAISAVFFGQKRYLFYNFGIFYMAYFLLLVQLWKCYGKDLLRKRREKRKAVS